MKEVKLKNLITFNKGFAFSSNDYLDDSTQKMVVRITDFTADSISKDNAVFIYYLDRYSSYVLHENDILVQTVGSWENNPLSIVGKVVRVPEECEGDLLNQNIVRLIPTEEINNLYLYYALKGNCFSKYCVIRGQGAANQASITLQTIGKFKFKIHEDIRIQDKIVTLLNNYDKLINNNNKRIKLLERMAQSIYIQWFVKARYCHLDSKETKIEQPRGWIFGKNKDGLKIPKKWRLGELSNIAEFKRGKNITASEMVEGNIPVISAGLEPSGYHNESNVKQNNITISASGANAGFLSYHLENIWAADCSYYFNDNNVWFVFNTLKFLQPVLTNMQIGSAQPHVYPKNINRICVIIPEQQSIQSFNEVVMPMYDEIKYLIEKNSLLEKQRDKLLSKIVTNKIVLEGKEMI